MKYTFKQIAYSAMAIPAVLALVSLAGCATTQANVQTFQRSAARVCSIVQPTLTSVISQSQNLTPPLPDNEVAVLTKANETASVFCGAVASATPGDALSMINAVIPPVSTVIAKSTLDPNVRNTLILSLTGVQVAANAVISQYEDSQTPVVPAPATPVAAGNATTPAAK